MPTITIKFTNKEVQALRHRLELWDALYEVFNDTDGMEHLADKVVDRCQEWCREFDTGKSLIVNTDEELDMLLLIEAIEGSTWVAVNSADNGNSHQQQSAAYKTLRGIADKIIAAFPGMKPGDILIPNH